MLTFFNVQGPQARLGRSGALLLALLLVYVVWGTTYFAIGIALQSMPPLWMNAIRFLCAGGLMLAVALWQGHALPTAVQWRNAALVGTLMVFCAMNCIGFAQKLGIGSGLMATVVTTMPMWLALWTRWGGERVPLTSWVGLALGVVGALLLALEGDFSATWQGALLAFGAPLCWSVGSYASRKLTLPAPAMASAAQWLVGGAISLVVAAWMEPVSALAHVSAKSWAAWVYLLVFGTLIALNAYLWLLQNASAALAGSYSFVNPAVALLVGVALGGELLTGWVFAALPLIAAALGCILYGPMVLALWQRNLAPRLRAAWPLGNGQRQA
jgi:drug/metabolite transporter (DMT)-like permease